MTRLWWVFACLSVALRGPSCHGCFDLGDPLQQFIRHGGTRDAGPASCWDCHWGCRSCKLRDCGQQGCVPRCRQRSCQTLHLSNVTSLGVDPKLQRPEVKNEVPRELPNTRRAVGRTLRDSDRALDDLERADEIIVDDLDRVAKVFVPRFHITARQFGWMGMGLLVAVGWLVFYFLFVYRDDRNEADARWLPMIGRDAARAAESQKTPDVMFVFYNPDYQREDADEPVAGHRVGRVLLTNTYKADRGEAFPRTRALTEAPTTMGAARKAILQDFYEHLVGSGFEVSPFRSLDGDEIFLRVSLRDENLIQRFFKKNHTLCQLRRSMVRAMDIVHKAEIGGEPASSPPFLPFTLNAAARLQDVEVAGRVPFKDFQDFRDVYRTFHGTDPEGSIARGRDRIAIVLGELMKEFDVDEAEQLGFIVDTYPVHTKSGLRVLRRMWGQFSLILDWTFLQPVHVLDHYFGARVAYFFAWTGFYCKALLALLPLALLCVAFLLLSVYFEWGRATVALAEAVFGIVVVVWAASAARMWQREQVYLIESWCYINDDQDTMNLRARFRGEWMESSLNANDKEKLYPEEWARFWRYTSGIATFLCCVINFTFLYVWTALFETGIYAEGVNYFAIVALAVQIKGFEIVFGMVANFLTDLENHKTQSQHANALIWKSFTFQFVNYYSPFFYLMLLRKFTAGGCPRVIGVGQSCVVALQIELGLTLLLLSVFRIIEVGGFSWYAKLQLEEEKKKMADYLENEEPGSAREAQLTHAFMEKQAKYSEFHVSQQVETHLQLVISLGFILLFGSVAPIVVVFAFVFFNCQLRASAWLLTHVCKRPPPWGSRGVGAWREVVYFLMVLGIFVSGLIIVIHDEVLQDVPMVTRVTCCLLWCAAGLSVLGLSTFMLPEEDGQTALMKRRRGYVDGRLRDLFDVHKAKSMRRSTVRIPVLSNEITSAQFSQVPVLDESHPDWDTVGRRGKREEPRDLEEDPAEERAEELEDGVSGVLE
mmetsp:Transcript_11163/g.25184  ORF Transcript_11163/g.25184 Transcript_11163/m.25184 type:complete len:993 (+) Transcript_11163:177-3155(+)